ncbi:FUN14 domain-containing protein 1-like [Oppia nitens]|uniref:FUN14 domain-containing protein 1-like n=1 Tax=Oppia nitens TaxID=1686743 RepID=UPI0023DAD765|nr:FUN14 domain-containing protein 1-like [Oppia nitens]
MTIKDNNSDDMFEVLNSSDDAFSYVNKYYKDLKKSSSAKQLTVGAISGWTAGFVLAKFGRTAGAAIGGAFLLLNMAHYNGYIRVDWKRLNRDFETAKKELKRKDKEVTHLMTRLQIFAKQNVVFASGFAGGLLLGISSA